MILRRALVAIWLVLVIVICVADKLYPQDVATGGITGIVQDQTGARIATARVIATDQATGLRHGTMTDDDGIFHVRLLPPGTYSLQIDANGMTPLQANAVTVQLGSETELKLTMRIGSTETSVTVTETPADVKTQSQGNSSEIIDEKSI